MAAYVQVNLKIGGQDSLKQALSSITQSVQREAAKQIEATQRVSRARQTSADREQANRDRDARKQQDKALRELDKEAQAFEKSERRKTQIIERETEKRRRAEEKAAIGRRNAVVGGAVGGIRSAVGTMGAVGGMAVSAVGTAGILSAVDSAVQLEKSIAQIAADVSDGGKTIDQKEYRDKAQSIAARTGISALDVAAGMEAASSSGGGMTGLSTFMKIIDQAGTLSLASGTKLADIAQISAGLTNASITDPQMQMELLRAMHSGAKGGNVNLRDMATGVPAVMGAFSAMGFKGDARSQALASSAFIQMARLGGAKNAEDSITAARNMLSDIGNHQKQLDKLGVKTTTGPGNTERVDPLVQFKDLMKKTGGDLKKIDQFGHIFGSQSQALVGAFKTAYAGKNTSLTDANGNVLKGDAALDALFAKFTGANMSQKDVEKDADIVKNTTGQKFAIEMEKFKAVVGNTLLPELTKLTPHFSKLAGASAEFVKVFAAHPYAVAGGLVALRGGIGAAEGAIGSFASQAMAGSGTLATAAGGAATALGALTALVIGAAAGYAAAKVLDNANEEELDLGKKRMTDRVSELRRLVQEGKASPEQQQELVDWGRVAAYRSKDDGAVRNWGKYVNQFGTNAEENIAAGNGGVMDYLTSYMPGVAELRGAYAAAGGSDERADYTAIGEAIAQTIKSNKIEADQPLLSALSGELQVRITNPQDIKTSRDPASQPMTTE